MPHKEGKNKSEILEKEGKQMTEDKSKKIVMIDIDKIIPNRERQLTINDEEIKTMALSIKQKSQIQPVLVRPVGDKFEAIRGLRRILANKSLGRKKVPAIIQEYDNDDAAYEAGLISLLCRRDIPSKEHEKAVNTRWKTGKKNGKYKSIADCAKKLGRSQRNISDLINMYEDRQEIFGHEGHSDHISTDTLRRIKTLSLSEKKKFCDRIKDGKIKPGDAEEVVNVLKSVSSEIREEILDGNFKWQDVKTVIEKRQPVIKAIEDAIAMYHKKETIQDIIEKEKLHYSSEPFRKLFVFTNTISSKYINNIGDKNEIKQVIRYLRISATQLFQVLHDLKVIDTKQYQNICNVSEISPEIIQQLRDDGHYYFFPDEWLTPTEKKLKEKMDKILNGKDEPLLR